MSPGSGNHPPDRLAAWPPLREALVAALLVYAIIFGTAALGTARWMAYTAFLYVPAGFAWLRGIDFAQYGLFLRNKAETLGVTLVMGLGVLGLFAGGYALLMRWMPDLPFPWAPGFDASSADLAKFAVTQLLVVGLAEEFFYRGYLQNRFDARFTPRWRILGADLGPGWILSAALFAGGHLGEGFDPARLATFIPGLWFGWIRARTGNIYGGAFLHAASNVLIAYLQGQSIAGR